MTVEENSDKLPSNRFMKVYNNLPMEERDQTVIVMEDDGDEEPVSWKMAKREIMEETDLGKKIMEKLKQLDII